MAPLSIQAAGAVLTLIKCLGRNAQVASSAGSRKIDAPDSFIELFLNSRGGVWVCREIDEDSKILKRTAGTKTVSAGRTHRGGRKMT